MSLSTCKSKALSVTGTQLTLDACWEPASTWLASAGSRGPPGCIRLLCLCWGICNSETIWHQCPSEGMLPHLQTCQDCEQLMSRQLGCEVEHLFRSSNSNDGPETLVDWSVRGLISTSQPRTLLALRMSVRICQDACGQQICSRLRGKLPYPQTCQVFQQLMGCEIECLINYGDLIRHRTDEPL